MKTVDNTEGFCGRHGVVINKKDCVQRLKKHVPRVLLTQFNNYDMAKKGNRFRSFSNAPNIKIADCQAFRGTLLPKQEDTPDRLELKKYNPILKKYTIHREIK
jgi:large subunit ribosomal protein L33